MKVGAGLCLWDVFPDEDEVQRQEQPMALHLMNIPHRETAHGAWAATGLSCFWVH